MKEYRNQVNKDFPNQGFESGDQKDARELEFQSWKKEYMLKLRRNELRWKREVARFQRDREARQRAREQKEAEQAEESEDHPIGEAEVDDESGMQDVPDDHRMDEEVPGSLPLDARATTSPQKPIAKDNEVSTGGGSLVPETQLPPQPLLLPANNKESTNEFPEIEAISQVDEASKTLQDSVETAGDAPEESTLVDPVEVHSTSRSRVSARLGLLAGNMPACMLANARYKDDRRKQRSATVEPWRLPAKADYMDSSNYHLQIIEDNNDILAHGACMSVPLQAPRMRGSSL
jgi:hypothetical protein